MDLSTGVFNCEYAAEVWSCRSGFVMIVLGQIYPDLKAVMLGRFEV